MTEREQSIIISRRENGDSMASIAKDLGLNVNTVKSFCRRHNINFSNAKQESCLTCGVELPAYKNGRPRRFCSNQCRHEYWNAHPKQYQTSHVCTVCGQSFKARKSRKYCSHTCYIADRFGDSK